MTKRYRRNSSQLVRYMIGKPDEVWPEIKGYTLNGLEWDVADACYQVEYTSESGNGEYHSVTIGDGTGPKEVVAYCLGTFQPLGVKWTPFVTSVREIPGILRLASQFADSTLKRVLRPFKKPVPGWRMLEWENIDVDFVFLESDFSLGVHFSDPDDAILRRKPSKVVVNWTEGSDYTGSWGKKEVLSYKAARDIPKVLAEAERLYRKWTR